jgi:hypothetical protein
MAAGRGFLVTGKKCGNHHITDRPGKAAKSAEPSGSEKTYQFLCFGQRFLTAEED